MLARKITEQHLMKWLLNVEIYKIEGIYIKQKKKKTKGGVQ